MRKILVIEDELGIRENIVEMLDMEGFQPLEAENGKIGLELATIEKPDLILCDVMMPKMNGYDVLIQLRENSNTAAIPFIFLTAKSDKNDFRKGMQLGADDYLTKPCSTDELLQAINTRLKKQEKLTVTYTQTINKALEQINHLVYYDVVTSLPNRLLLADKFNQIIQDNKEVVPIFSLTIDRLAQLKEILEQSQLESFLQSLADRLRNCLNKQDILARFSDEQFVIILANIKDEKQAENIAENILNNIGTSFVIRENQEIFITMSIGISFYPQDGIFIEKLVQNAQKAQKQSRDNGGINKYYLYTPELHKESDERIAIEANLIHA
ncbi:MAG TPA: response regulator, partial [Allocoleopsis sp.]